MVAAVTLERSVEVRQTFAQTVARVVSGGQFAAAAFAAAYLRGYVLPVEPIDVTGALTGVLLAASDPKAVVGLLRMWHLIDEGAGIPEARLSAATYARGLAEGDMQTAQRAGLDAAAQATRQAVRWRKVAGPDACDWCQAIAGGPAPARYFSAASVPMHMPVPGKGRGVCRCSVAPEFVTERLTREGEWRLAPGRQQLSAIPDTREHPSTRPPDLT